MVETAIALPKWAVLVFCFLLGQFLSTHVTPKIASISRARSEGGNGPRHTVVQSQMNGTQGSDADGSLEGAAGFTHGAFSVLAKDGCALAALTCGHFKVQERLV